MYRTNSRGMRSNPSVVIRELPQESVTWAPTVAGLSLIGIAVISLGVIVSVGQNEAIAVIAGIMALGFCVWGLFSATKGAYREGVGSLSGGAGLVLVFVAPLSQSVLWFTVTGGLVVLFSGVFLLAGGLGYEVLSIDDGAGSDTDDVERETDTDA